MQQLQELFTMTITDQLLKTKEETLSYFDLDSAYLNKQYDYGKWSIKELLHHLADAETVLYERIRRGISEKNLVVWGFDQDAWCQHLDYENQDLYLNKSIYTSIRDANIALVKSYYVSHGDNQYVHSETGLRTVKDEMEKVAWHNEHHLKQIRKALEL